MLRRALLPVAVVLLSLACAPETGDGGAGGAADAGRVDRPDAGGAVGPQLDVPVLSFDVQRVDAGPAPDTGPAGAAVLIGPCPVGTNRPECVCVPRTQTPCYPGPMAQVNVGLCRAGMARCEAPGEFGTWGTCTGSVGPSPERCDGLDNDCDGTVDDGCACRPGTTRPCYTGPANTMAVGLCRAGSQGCVAGANNVGSTWGACTGSVLPAAEVCNGLDDNCNGRADDGIGCVCTAGMARPCYSGPAGTASVGPCRVGTQTCLPSRAGWTACTGERTPSAELCNGVDDDCNGRVDDNPACTPPMLACPNGVSGTAGTPVAIDVMTSPGAACRWTVVERPMGAGAEGTFGNPNACDTTFTSVIVGNYLVELAATDAMGRTVRCRVHVTLTGRGLRVELAWTTTGDVDLHMLHPMAPSWFTRPYDCYFANTAPTWDGGGPFNPRLDVDNTSQFGPENIRIDTPTPGSTYRVGVHAYSRVNAGAPCTVRIYCGNNVTPIRTFTRTLTSRASSGDNDFWLVADVNTMASSGCSVTPIDRIVTTTVSRTMR